MTTKDRQYVVDQKGRRVGILLDVKTYEKLLESEEELKDIRAFDEAKNTVKLEVREGKAVTLQEYLRKRKRKAR